jgi:type IX secretion system PorP/SprF family membrane protein
MKIKILIALLFGFTTVQAQDPIFTQYFMAPQSNNPGFTGFMETTYAGIIHRSQWPSSNLKIVTNYAFLNMWVEDMNSGIGVSFLNHRESFTDYHYNQANISYSYRVQLENDWYFRPAIEVGFGNKSYGFQNLVLEDQLNIGTGTIDATSIDPIALNEKQNFIDLSAGALFNNEFAWIGLSLKHLNRPNISFTQAGNQPLEMFMSVSGGYELPVANFLTRFLPYDTKMIFLGNYMRQSEFNRFDLGAQLIVGPAYIGIVAATNPGRKSDNSHLLTSINLIAGLQYEHFRFGYSYDLNTSGIGRTGGIHELGMTYQFDLKAKCFGCPNYE